MIGTRLSHYQILEPLGEGGMGVVYRARDERLERDVAIKVLPAGALAHAANRRQFRREALALSKLNHPNIAMVFDFDSQDGVDFLVQELVPGVTLSERIADGPLPEQEAARLGQQLAEGLSAAHKEGVLHRDIKPGNLRLTPDGRLKILDFGLAKLLRPAGELSTTQTMNAGDHIVVGTLPYMPPEQLRGGRVDVRSDVYAAGAVLYEMTCGRRAFPQDSSHALVFAILHQPPVPPREVSPEVSVELERIILRCLEKDPASRYGGAAELGSDLRELALPTPRRSLATNVQRRRRWARVVVIAAVGLAVTALSLVAANVGGLRQRVFGGGSNTVRSIAVLPLANLSGDPGQEYFADGMTDELITLLAQVGALRVISRSSAMAYKGTKKPLRQIARELNVNMIVEGSVLRSGDAVRISAQLIDVLRDRHVWAESYERALSSVIGLQSEVARAIVENVRVRVTNEERSRLERAPPINPQAHEVYLQGLFHFNTYSVEGLQTAVDYFQRAVAIDPRYAPPHVGLANSYFFLSSSVLPPEEAVPRARAAAARALELDPNLSGAHVSTGIVKTYEWRWAESERSFRRAMELNPGEVSAHQYLSALLTALGRFEEAEKEIALARRLDPLNPLVSAMSLWPLFEGRQYDRAISAARVLVEADPNVWNSHLVLGQAYLMRGEMKAGLAEIQRAVELDPRNPVPLGWLAFGYSRGGNRAKAAELLGSLRKWSRTAYVQPYLFALVHAELGEREAALGWLEKSVDARSDEIFFLKVDPGMDSLRAEPRFQAILKRMGL